MNHLHKSLLTVGLIAMTTSSHANTALTIYNDNFAVVRDSIPLNVKAGQNQVDYSNITGRLEPDSLILRTQNTKWQLSIIEQSYLSNPINQNALLSHFEGKEIPFEIIDDGKRKTIKGKVVRSGFQNSLNSTPIIEVDGKLRFGLPGTPLFPSLGDDAILNPTVNWLLHSNKAGNVNADISYITGGFSWKSDYNVVTKDDSNKVDVIGWITVKNNSGKKFENTKVKLMAGDVNKVEEYPQHDLVRAEAAYSMRDKAAPNVTEKSFDEFHLYSIAHPTTLKDGESKQIEFLRAENVTSNKRFIYDGSRSRPNFGSSSRYYGGGDNNKVWIVHEIKNSKKNNLGVAMPKGRMRLYKQDTDTQLEFIGENNIEHTPKDELVRVYSGNAFDIVGERKQTDQQSERNGRRSQETYEITLKNHKESAVTIDVHEHFYNGGNWKIINNSDDYKKENSRTAIWRVKVPADGKKVIRYTVKYSY